MRRSNGHNRSAGEDCLPPLWIISIMATTLLFCGGCEGRYMRDAPPVDELCGVWRIDLARTKWKDAAPLLTGGSKTGHLLLRRDGTFSFRTMPNLSLEYSCMSTPTFGHRGAGRWWTKPDNDIGSYLWLNIEELDGQQQQRDAAGCACIRPGSAYFRWDRATHEYLLCFIIKDPDSGEELVLKKVAREETEESFIVREP